VMESKRSKKKVLKKREREKKPRLFVFRSLHYSLSSLFPPPKKRHF
jgi:hypothetical protein